MPGSRRPLILLDNSLVLPCRHAHRYCTRRRCRFTGVSTLSVIGRVVCAVPGRRPVDHAHQARGASDGRRPTDSANCAGSHRRGHRDSADHDSQEPPRREFAPPRAPPVLRLGAPCGDRDRYRSSHRGGDLGACDLGRMGPGGERVRAAAAGLPRGQHSDRTAVRGSPRGNRPARVRVGFPASALQTDHRHGGRDRAVLRDLHWHQRGPNCLRAAARCPRGRHHPLPPTAPTLLHISSRSASSAWRSSPPEHSLCPEPSQPPYRSTSSTSP